MKLSSYTVEVLEIQEPGDRLDPIRVIFRPVPDPRYSQGEVIVTCYDRVWKTWFGNMVDDTLKHFVQTCVPGYLANRLAESAGSKLDGKHRARDEAYLLKVVTVIQAALVQQHAADLDVARKRVAASNAPTLVDLLVIPPPAAA